MLKMIKCFYLHLFLIISEIAYLFICLFSIYISSLNCFTHFLFPLSYWDVYLIDLGESLHIMAIKLCFMHTTNIVSQAAICLLPLLIFLHRYF